MPYAPDLSGCALEDRYELRAVIGEGAFGRVYEGRDRRLDRPVAVKVIKPWWTEDPEWVAAFERETRLLARVSDPGIVQIFDVGHAPEGLYYVAELVEGENLAGRLRRGPLPAWEACGVATQLCRALAHAHARRIVHRDVKPANILLSRQGRVKVGDFGVARLAEGSTDGNAHSPTIVGTPRYMAPEQGRGLPTTPATDVYSVGVVLYEMLAGAPPFTGDSVVELALSHLQDSAPPLSVRLPPALVQITQRALAKDPAHRYADGAEMADALVDARRRSESGRPAAPAFTSTRVIPRAAPQPVGVLVGAGGRDRAPVPAPPPPRLAPSPPRQLPSRPRQLPSRPRQPPSRPRRHVPAGPPPWGADDTRRAPEMSPRRNVNPAARRRTAAALTLVVALLAAMVAGAVLLGGAARTRVPRLTRLARAAAVTQARRAHLTPSFSRSYAAAPAGTVIGQHPRPGARVAVGTRIDVVLSQGPAPVPLPRVSSQSVGDAQQSLTSLGLRTTVRSVPAPGITPGTVVGQAPGAGHTAAVGSTVTLSVAETPRWRPVATFQGAGSGPVHISGERWRIVYRMAYQGACTWIVFCSGPHAQVVDTATGQTAAAFGLSEGTGQVRSFATGPGTYQVQVTRGGDDARWSVQVQDYF